VLRYRGVEGQAEPRSAEVLLRYNPTYKGYIKDKKYVAEAVAETSLVAIPEAIPLPYLREPSRVTVAAVAEPSSSSSSSSTDRTKSPPRITWNTEDEEEIDAEIMSQNPNVPNLKEMMRQKAKDAAEAKKKAAPVEAKKPSGVVLAKRKPEEGGNLPNPTPADAAAAHTVSKKRRLVKAHEVGPSKSKGKAKVSRRAEIWAPQLLVDGVTPITAADTVKDLGTATALAEALMLPRDVEPYADSEDHVMLRTAIAHNMFVSFPLW
jgi:hypothetical protein